MSNNLSFMNKIKFILTCSDGVWDCITKSEVEKNVKKILFQIPANLSKNDYSQFILNKLMYGDNLNQIEGFKNTSLRLFGNNADDVTAQLIFMIPHDNDIIISSYTISEKNPQYNKENQDYYCTFNDDENYLFCVCDGHGSGYTGRFTSKTVCNDLLFELGVSPEDDRNSDDMSISENDDDILMESSYPFFEEIKENPTLNLKKLFHQLNTSLYIKSKNIAKSKTNYVKEIFPENYQSFPYLIKSDSSRIIQGGTTCTLIILTKVANNWPKILCSNVGDSESILCEINIVDQTSKIELLTNPCSNEDYNEFYRIRNFNCDPNNNLLTRIKFFIMNKSGEFKPLFKICNNDIIRENKNVVGFYKNINYERASSLMFYSQYDTQGLAYTRSIGDFALKHLGVTYEPFINLKYWN